MTYLLADPVWGPVLAILILLAVVLGVTLIYAVVIPKIWWLLTGQVIVNVFTRSKTQWGRYRLIRKETPPWRMLFDKRKRP